MEHTVIVPKKWNIFGIKDVLNRLELLWMFVWRDIKIRYKQTVLGILWVVFQPLVTMLIITVFFGMVIRVPSSGLPYPVFFLSAYVMWVLFYDGVLRTHTEIVKNSAIITKVYFPRIIIPIAGVIAPVVDFLIAVIILAGLMIFYGMSLISNVVIIPLLMVWSMSLSFGIGAFVSAIHVKWRDIQYAVSFLTMTLMYASPIIYPSSMVPEQYLYLYYMNPLAWIVDGMRYALFDLPLSTQSPIPAILITGCVLVVGTVFFEYCENKFADWI